jgi:hypothetical protein
MPMDSLQARFAAALLFALVLATVPACESSSFSGTQHAKSKDSAGDGHADKDSDALADAGDDEDSRDENATASEVGKDQNKDGKNTTDLSFILDEVLKADGDLSDDDKLMIGCLRGVALTGKVSTAALRNYKVVEINGVNTAYKTFVDHPADSPDQVLLIKLGRNVVSHADVKLKHPRGVYCIEMQGNDFAFFDIARACSAYVNVRMNGDKVSHLNWADANDPSGVGTAGGEFACSPSVPSVPDKAVSAVRAEKSARDLDKLLGDGANDKLLKSCLADAKLPSALTDAAIKNYRTVEAQAIDVSHFALLDDVEATTDYRVTLVNVTAAQLSHGYVYALNPLGIYCVAIKDTEISHYTQARHCGALVFDQRVNFTYSFLYSAPPATTGMPKCLGSPD